MINKQTDTIRKPVTLRFYAGLNDFLPGNFRHKPFIHRIKTPVTIGETIISLNIPLSELGLVLVNSEPSELKSKLRENDYVSVYPSFRKLDISGLTGRSSPVLPLKFITDSHLGKLAKYLRMLGFDTLFDSNYDDMDMLRTSVKESRIILTRDRGILNSEEVRYGYYVRSTEKTEQFKEVIERYSLLSYSAPFTRCMVCNNPLNRKDIEEIRGLAAEMPSEYNEFFYCEGCKRVYWKGSHYTRMNEFIASIKEILP